MADRTDLAQYRLGRVDPLGTAASPRRRFVDHLCEARLSTVRHALRPTFRAARALAPLAPFALAYALACLLRNVNVVLAPDIARELGLGPAQLGTLVAAYFVAGAAVQLPLGVALDRFGATTVQATLLAVAALGSALCAWGEGVGMLFVGRILIGLGTAAAFTTAATAATTWCRAPRLPWVNATFLAAGGLGALAATLPAQAVLEAAGWRCVMAAIAGCCALVALAVLAAQSPSRPTITLQASPHRAFTFGPLLRDRVLQATLPLLAATTGSVFALQSLWAGPHLSAVHGFTPAQTVAALAGMALVMLASTPLWGALTILLRRRIGLPWALFACAAVLLGLEALLLPAPGHPALLLPDAGPLLPWLGIAAFTASTVLGFSLVADQVPHAALGRANALANAAQFIVAFAVQAGMGLVIEAYASNPALGHRVALVLPMALQSAGLLWFAARIPGRARAASPGRPARP